MTNAPVAAGDAIVLRSDRLAVEIARPGAAYRGTRFDWTGFVTQVTLDGTHTFLVPESPVPGQGTGGIGLCNEFGIERPVGYDDAQPGECFPKLGIGLLVRPDEAGYTFMRPYEIARRFPVHVETTDLRATFIVDPVECRGYAARLAKTLVVDGTGLEIVYRLENAGTRPIDTCEYCHNFCGIGGAALGPAYRLRMAWPVQLEDLTDMVVQQMPPRLRRLPAPLRRALARRFWRGMVRVLSVRGRELWPRRTPQRPFYCRLSEPAPAVGPVWELRHLPSGLCVQESDDFAPWRVAVWGTTHVISAEVFVDIRLEPGEAMSWTRRYRFGVTDQAR